MRLIKNANCCEGETLHLTYLLSAPDVREFHRIVYSDHLQNCPVCKANCTATFEHARRTKHPELTAEEIERA